MSHPDPTVYLNGQYLPLSQAHISVLDRGFLFGDAVYEVIVSYHGKPFQVDEHWARLVHSFEGIQMANPLSRAAFDTLLHTLVDKNPDDCLMLYVQISRGVGNKRSHAPTADLVPTVFAMATPFTPTPIETLAKGYQAAMVPDTRWKRCDIKSTALLANVLALKIAQDRLPEACEAILVDHDYVQEGASSSVFVVKAGRILLPRLSRKLLPGITRQTVVSLAERLGIEVAFEPISTACCLHADEVMVTSTTREIFPIVQIDKHRINNGKPGPVWHRLIKEIKELTNS